MADLPSVYVYMLLLKEGVALIQVMVLAYYQDIYNCVCSYTYLAQPCIMLGDCYHGSNILYNNT